MSAAVFRAESIGRDRVHPVLETAGDHGLLAPRLDEIGRVRDQISAGQRQAPGSLGEAPVEADHEPHADPVGAGERGHREAEIPGVKHERLAVEQVDLPIVKRHASRCDQHGAVVEARSVRGRHALGQADHEAQSFPSRQFHEPRDGGPFGNGLGEGGGLVRRGEHVTGERQLREHHEVGITAGQRRFDPVEVVLGAPEAGLRLQESDPHHRLFPAKVV